MRCLDYSALRARLSMPRSGAGQPFGTQNLQRELSALWTDVYLEAFPNSEIVSVTLETFDYLFDLTAERNVAAYGIMVGRNTAARDHARMAGHPKAEGQDYHRGHMIPHSGHGGTDINLFSQLGSVNIGQFRQLERLAVANPGSFYFVRMIYDDAGSQRPAFVEQGLAVPSGSPALDVRLFPN
jgi:hypothetical protein